jgi:hypothetical protein
MYSGKENHFELSHVKRNVNGSMLAEQNSLFEGGMKNR